MNERKPQVEPLVSSFGLLDYLAENEAMQKAYPQIGWDLAGGPDCYVQVCQVTMPVQASVPLVLRNVRPCYDLDGTPILDPPAEE